MIRLIGLTAIALVIATAPAGARSGPDRGTQQAQQQQETPRYECRRVRRCRPVVTCHPYSWEPWTCLRRRDCEIVRECTPIGGPPAGYEY